MDDALALRNHMAEQGIEYTPAQAKDALCALEEFRQDVHNNSRIDPEQYENLKDLTLEEKLDLCEQFAEQGEEVTLDELDQLIEITLDVYEQERLF